MRIRKIFDFFFVHSVIQSRAWQDRKFMIRCCSNNKDIEYQLYSYRQEDKNMSAED